MKVLYCIKFILFNTFESQFKMESTIKSWNIHLECYNYHRFIILFIVGHRCIVGHWTFTYRERTFTNRERRHKVYAKEIFISIVYRIFVFIFFIFSKNTK